MPEKPPTITAEEVEQLRAKLAEAELKLLSIPTAGLVWEEQVERPELEMRTHLPVLKAKPALDVEGAQPSDIPHILIEGDNLHALTIMQATHKGKVDVIYIDPPYNTGNNDFRYDDNFVNREDQWRHSAWLSFMDKRLRLARELMAPQGVIFISIDDNEQAHLKLLCDQVFGESNVVAQMVWESRPQGGNDSKYLRVGYEYILCCVKDADVRTSFNSLVVSREKYKKSYAHVSTRGKYSLTKLDNGTMSYSDGLNYGIEMEDGTTLYPNGRSEFVNDGWNWRWSKDTVGWGVANDFVVFEKGKNGTWSVKTKEYELVERKTIKGCSQVVERTPSVAKALVRLGEEGLGGSPKPKDMVDSPFNNPKPVYLIDLLLRSVSNRNSVVLDFFAGSGTTAHAVSYLNSNDGGNRQCILLTDNSGKVDKKFVSDAGTSGICRAVTQPRIKAALTGQWADGEPHDALPGSLVYYQVDLLGRRSSRAAERAVLSKRATEIVACAENTHTLVHTADTHTLLTGENRAAAVIPTDLYSNEYAAVYAEMEDALPGNPEHKTLYMFSGSDEPIADDLADQFPGWEVKPLPATILAAMRRGIRAAAARTPQTDEEN